MKSVHSAVRTGSLNKAACVSSLNINVFFFYSFNCLCNRKPEHLQSEKYIDSRIISDFEGILDHECRNGLSNLRWRGM